MTKTQHLLTVLSEECAEVTQRASKAIRFGISEIQPGQPEDNRRRLERELADLMAVAELLGLKIREEDKVAKIEKLKKYMALSRELGMLEPEVLKLWSKLDGHVCGLQGFGQSINDRCPACEAGKK